MAVLRRAWVGHGLQDFWLYPCLPPILCLISSSFGWHIQQITFSQQILNDLKTFWRRCWRYSQAYVGFDRLNHSKWIFIATENRHAGETFMLGPVLFSLARQCPSIFSFQNCHWSRFQSIDQCWVCVCEEHYTVPECIALGKMSGVHCLRNRSVYEPVGEISVSK